jgi:hypothetical protein
MTTVDPYYADELGPRRAMPPSTRPAPGGLAIRFSSSPSVPAASRGIWRMRVGGWLASIFPPPCWSGPPAMAPSVRRRSASG